MAGQASSGDDEITGINITPLVDIMLVLLIIFMVTANFVSQKAFQVALPKAATGESVPAQSRNLGFVIDKESKVYLDGTKLEESALAERVRALVAAGGPLVALVSADTESQHGALVRLMDLLRKEGVREFALNVEQQ